MHIGCQAFDENIQEMDIMSKRDTTFNMDHKY